MSSERTEYIAVGDVHGCNLTLLRLLEDLEPYFELRPTFVFLGDYVDRGPDSKGVIDTLIEFQKHHDCVFLRGNHDQVMLEALESRMDSEWRMMGGMTTQDSYQGAVPESHIEFLRNTQIYFDTDDFMFVHAGAPVTVSLEEGKNHPTASNYYLWGRGHLNRNDLPWEKTLVFGHTPMKEVLITQKMICVDTGCVYEEQGFGMLTAISLPDKALIQQKCIDFKN